MPPPEPLKLAVISLGCPKNIVDTERAMGQLVGKGVAVVDDPREADWILINTCGFIEEAKAESIEMILEIASLKEQHPQIRIAVAGCLSQRYGHDLAGELPEVDFTVGLLTRENVALLERKMTGTASPLQYAEHDDRQRFRITPRHTAYLRISEGCNNRCSYCAIPEIRGPLKSRPFESVIADAQELLGDGAVEINIVAQDTTVYGLDLYGKSRLGEVVGELARLNPSGWVRILYAHPAHLEGDVIDALEGGFPLVPYLDLPLQHINDRLLTSMGRNVTRARVEALIKELRSRVAGLFIRTAFIIGFPGETEREFAELIDFVESTRFERLGAFPYSHEEGTRAYDFDGLVSDEEKYQRLDRLMAVQKTIAFEQNRSLVGKRLAGIIDAPSGRDDLKLAGRLYGDAPEVDGTVFTGGAEVGRIVTFEITGVEDYDLIAEVVS